MDYAGNIFLPTMPSSQLREIGFPLLVQIFMSTPCMLLFIAGENA
jgi:5'-3' exonuclease